MPSSFYRVDPKSPHVKRSTEAFTGATKKRILLRLNVAAMLTGPTSGAKASDLAEKLVDHGADNLIRELEWIVREYRK